MRKATDIFGEWAEKGKDIGMEKGHSAAVDEMVTFALKERKKIGKNFSFLDLGCGNGWVVRNVSNDSLCNRAVGIDGAKQMIANAKSRGGVAEYIFANIIYHYNFFIIRSEETTTGSLMSSIKKIQNVNAKIDGIIINDLDTSKDSYYSYYYSYNPQYYYTKN